MVDDRHLIGQAAIRLLSGPGQRRFFRDRLLVRSDHCDRSGVADGEPDIAGDHVVPLESRLLAQLVSSRRQSIVDLGDQTITACGQALVARHRVEVDRDHAVDFHLFVKREFHSFKRP